MGEQTGVGAALERLRERVEQERERLRNQHELQMREQERGAHGDSFSDGTRHIGEQLRQALAALRGGEAVLAAMAADHLAAVEGRPAGCEGHPVASLTCAACEAAVRARLESRAAVPTRDLCSAGCCRECDACAAKRGNATLCESCDARRLACNVSHRHATKPAPAAPADAVAAYMCEHANEWPAVCRCEVGCYCRKQGACRPAVYLEPGATPGEDVATLAPEGRTPIGHVVATEGGTVAVLGSCAPPTPSAATALSAEHMTALRALLDATWKGLPAHAHAVWKDRGGAASAVNLRVAFCALEAAGLVRVSDDGWLPTSAGCIAATAADRTAPTAADRAVLVALRYAQSARWGHVVAPAPTTDVCDAMPGNEDSGDIHERLCALTAAGYVHCEADGWLLTPKGAAFAGEPAPTLPPSDAAVLRFLVGARIHDSAITAAIVAEMLRLPIANVRASLERLRFAGLALYTTADCIAWTATEAGRAAVAAMEQP